MSERALIVVSRVASGERGDGFADLSPENRARAARVNEDGAPYPSAEWLTERAQIMAAITVPALRRVTVPFTWVWRVADERRDQACEIADELYPQAVVIDDRSLTADEVAPDAERFLTVRLDSDDALHPDALERALAVELAPGTLVNWWRGWQLDLATGTLAPKEWPLRVQGPFLGLTHESRATMLAAGVPHTFARTGRRVVHVDGRNWIQTLHDRNQLSRWQRGQDVVKSRRRDQVLADYGIAAALEAMC